MHLFDGVHYFLSTSFSEGRTNELSHVLDGNGASIAESIDDSSLTHFITNSNSFERWQEIATREEEGKLVVVTEQMRDFQDKWVDKSILLGKLQNASFYSADPAMIFSGVVACAAEVRTILFEYRSGKTIIALQLEATDLEVLSAGITALGGQWRTGLTKDVTHLFVTRNTSAKYTTAMHFRDDTHVKILLPHWFDDAVRLGISGLDTTPYEWPDPPMLRALDTEGGEGAKADATKRAALRKLDNEKKSLYRTADLLFPGAPLPNGEERMSVSSAESPRGKSKNVWEGRRVLLGRSLELSGSRRDAVEAEIRRAGGKTVSYEGGKDEEAAAIDECDVFVTRFRSGKAYVQAVKQSKTIGTLPWVFHVHSIGTLSPPMDQLLWYPIPKRPIEGFSGHDLSSISGQKTEKAASWSIPIVNHLWLEDCFVKWRNLTVALEKYIVFPPGVDFSRQLGDRGVGRAVEEIGEDDLEFLEQDDVEEIVVSAPQRDITGPIIKKKTNGSGYPLSTPGSARDAQEVEEVIRNGGDGNTHMQVKPQDFQANADEPEEPMEDEEDYLVPSRPTPTPRPTKSIAERIHDKDESAAKTRIKPRSKGKPTALYEEPSVIHEAHITERKNGEPGTTSMNRQSRATARNDTSSNSDDEVEIAETSAKKASKKLVRRVGERSESWIMDAVVVTPLRPKTVREIGDEDREDAPQKPRRSVLKKSPNKRVLSDEESEKIMVRKWSRKNVFNDEVDEADAQESITIDAKNRKKRMQLEDEDEEEASPTKAKSHKAIVELSSTSKKRKGKKRHSSLESEDEDLTVPTSRSKTRPNMVEIELPRPESIGKSKKIVEMTTGPSLILQPVASKPRVSAPKSKKTSPPTSDDEDEPSTSKKPVVIPRASTSKSKKAPKLIVSEVEEPSPVKRSTTKPGLSSLKSKAKKNSTHTSDGDSELFPPKTKKSKKAATPPLIDEDSDLTPPPISPAKTPKKTVQRPQKSKGKSKAVSSDESDGEDQMPLGSGRNYTTKMNDRSGPATGPVTSTTPKRAVSVLLPGLTLSTKKYSRGGNVVSTGLSRSDSIRVVAGERASTSRTATASGSATRPKKLVPVSAPSRSTSPSSTDDDDAPVISSGRTKRGAAARASQKLHEEIMPDVLNFQQEMRNVGKRRSLGAISIPGGHDSGNKRHPVESSVEGNGDSRDVKRQRLSASYTNKGETSASEDEEEDELSKPVKVKGKKKPDEGGESAGKITKVKTTKADDVDTRFEHLNHTAFLTQPFIYSLDTKTCAVRLMTTQVSLTDDVVKVLTRLGVKITVKPSECTHLLAPHLVRTEKFLCALASGPFILTDKWAIESAAARKLLDERKYLLRDKTNERKFEFVLADALLRAKELRGTLFSKMVFYITPKVPVDIKLLKNVVTACGGQDNGGYIAIPRNAVEAQDRPHDEPALEDTAREPLLPPGNPKLRGTFQLHSDGHSYSYSYGPRGVVGLLHNYYAFLCAFFASLGGLTFGYDQGVVRAGIHTSLPPPS
ncbi:hypothetical protein C0992_006373 [Termitomyces sp. T32_za158]|nr:hypothetical protein C0992_006373 [Termitomyces sp. T32_za158]